MGLFFILGNCPILGPVFGTIPLSPLVLPLNLAPNTYPAHKSPQLFVLWLLFLYFKEYWGDSPPRPPSVGGLRPPNPLPRGLRPLGSPSFSFIPYSFLYYGGASPPSTPQVVVQGFITATSWPKSPVQAQSPFGLLRPTSLQLWHGLLLPRGEAPSWRKNIVDVVRGLRPRGETEFLRTIVAISSKLPVNYGANRRFARRKGRVRPGAYRPKARGNIKRNWT